MSDHETTLRELAGYLLRTSDLYPRGSVMGQKQEAQIAACEAGADALRRGTCQGTGLRSATDPQAKETTHCPTCGAASDGTVNGWQHRAQAAEAKLDALAARKTPHPRDWCDGSGAQCDGCPACKPTKAHLQAEINAHLEICIYCDDRLNKERCAVAAKLLAQVGRS